MNSPQTQRELVVYTDFICPWCYIGAAHLKHAQETITFRARYIMFPLHPDIPPGGISLYDLFGGYEGDIDRRQLEIRGRALKLGLKYKTRTHSYNSFNSQVVGKGLAKIGKFEAFQDSVFNAYFGEGEDIGCPEVLQRLLNQLSPNHWSAYKMINDADLKASVRRDWETAKAHGVYSVPTYRFRNRYCAGTQTSTKLLALLREDSSENA